MPILQRIGGRKFFLGLVYLGCCVLLDFTAIRTAGATMSLGEMSGLAALNASLATGLGVVVWGNVQAAKNGG